MRPITFCSLFLLSFCSSSALLGQLQLTPYVFVTAAQDTVLAERGTFLVQENRSIVPSNSIQLSFIRFKSTNPNPASPIVYLSGGPGGSGSATARHERFELFMKLREVADVIAFDQRGTGMSNQLVACPFSLDIPIEQALTKDVYLERSIANLKQCKAFWDAEKVDLSAYNTTESAKDLEVLRQVLGTEKISLWGISYGSHLAFEYIRLFEKNLDKLVLASLEGPNETLRLPQKTDAFLDQLCERAQDNYGQTPKYPQLKNKIIAVHQRLKENPVVVTIEEKDGQKIPVGISDFELQLAITVIYLRDPALSKKLPQLYTNMYQGDFSNIAPMVKLLKEAIAQPEHPMSFAMDMHSNLSAARKKLIQQQVKTSLLGDGINYLLLEWIEELNYFRLPNDFRTLPKNQVEALLLSGTLDGRTYLSSAVAIAQQFEQGQHIIIDNAGHNLYMRSPIIGDLVLEFFKGNALNLKSIELQPTIFD